MAAYGFYAPTLVLKSQDSQVDGVCNGSLIGLFPVELLTLAACLAIVQEHLLEVSLPPPPKKLSDCDVGGTKREEKGSCIQLNFVTRAKMY
jgi:hypothetical protein